MRERGRQRDAETESMCVLVCIQCESQKLTLGSFCNHSPADELMGVSGLALKLDVSASLDSLL